MSSLSPEDLLAPHGPAIVELVQRLRRIVKGTMPEAEERAYPVWRGIGYIHPSAGYVCAIFPYREFVALAFEYGVLLADPAHLLRPGRTSSRRVRYLEVRTSKDIRVSAIRALLREAIALRRARPRNNQMQIPTAARARKAGRPPRRGNGERQEPR